MPLKPRRAATYDVVLAVAREQPGSRTFLVALATDPEGHGSIVFQTASVGGVDEQDVRLGMDSYCVVTGDGACAWGASSPASRTASTSRSGSPPPAPGRSVSSGPSAFASAWTPSSERGR